MLVVIEKIIGVFLCLSENGICDINFITFVMKAIFNISNLDLAIKLIKLLLRKTPM